jgi:hypothetical protein
MNVVKMGAGRGLSIALASLLALGVFASSASAEDAKAAAAPNTRMEIRKSSEDAGVASVVGRVTVESGGESSRVNAGTRFRAGDVVRVASGSRLSVRFADEATMALVGPAEMQFVEMNPEARRVLLRSGVVSEAYMQGVATEIATPYDGALVLQNATGFARVALGDRVSFQKLDGDLAQVYHQDELQPLDGGWTLNVRSGDLDSGALASTAGTTRQGNMSRMVLGDRQISWGPPEDFKLERMGEKTKLTYVGDDYGVVKVGPHSTVFFLSNGESITFDEHGNVIQFDGISHIYHPLNNPLPDYDEPVENAADASVSGPGRR